LSLALSMANGRPAEGARSSPTATATPTSTPTSTAAPAAPSGVTLTGNALSWKDNSNNEDGFYLDLIACWMSVFERTFHYQTPANATSFPLPEEYLQALQSCPCGNESWTVTAFNSFGRASSTATRTNLICAPSATATPAPIVMPPTGAGEQGSGWSWPWAGVAGGLALMGAGAAAFAYARGSRGKR
jgi:hypothetical protein